MGICEDCGKERELLEVVGMMLCSDCIAPPADAPRSVFLIDDEHEKVASVIVPGHAVNERGELRSAIELEGL
jgi:hypothetical protein